MPRPRQPETIDELLDRVVVCASGCWIWTGGDSGTDRDRAGAGYGRILRPGTRNAMAAHRYVYEKFVGPIPSGQQLDHLCAAWSLDPWLNRRCVNPAHLEPVSHNENNVRKRRTMARTAEIALPPPDDQPAPLLAPGERVEDWVL